MKTVSSKRHKVKGKLHRVTIEGGRNGVMIRAHRRMPANSPAGMAHLAGEDDEGPILSTKLSQSKQHMHDLLTEFHNSGEATGQGSEETESQPGAKGAPMAEE
jgi:hypothetical protein